MLKPHPPSATRDWPLLSRFIAREAALGGAVKARGPWTAGFYEFLRFGVKQAWACFYGGLMLALLLGTWLLYPRDAALPRYDFLTLAALALQVALIGFRLETKEEALVILIFHLVGTGMEIFKTAVGSWAYPEESYLRIGGVPLFTGFMYAAVGSYIARVWRLFDFRFSHHPPLWSVLLLATGIYANFFLHHYWWDLRWGLFALAALLFGRCWVYFRVWDVDRRMPLLVGFALVALFIWFAENLGTFAGAWIYPNQKQGWTMVSFAKFGSWYLLMLISYSLVAMIRRPQERKDTVSL
ncbi:MAG: DUF817 domain-containing protein [Niveispirillum sp.]|uniref:DUF817 domain-containing protein n=1 Tax=Niveispirillum sp. TaxID=1917217 RepID=UPI0040351536